MSSSTLRSFIVEQEIRGVPIYGLKPLDASQLQTSNATASTISHCNACKRAFSMFRWRKQCGTCGATRCGECCPEALAVPGKKDKARICVECMAALKKKNEASLQQQAAASSSSSIRSSTQPVFVSSTASSSTMDLLRQQVATTVYDFECTTAGGKKMLLSDFRGRPLLVVNIASKCGFTDSGYQKMLNLLTKFRERGLAVIAQPSNQFKQQEPGSDADIVEFACARMKTSSAGAGADSSFVILQKADVNGVNATPLYKYLCAAKKHGPISSVTWNFVVFVIGQDGRPRDRFLPTADESAIEASLLPHLLSEADFLKLQAEKSEKEREEIEQKRRRADERQQQAERARAEEERKHKEKSDKEEEKKKMEEQFSEAERKFVEEAKREQERKEKKEQVDKEKAADVPVPVPVSAAPAASGEEGSAAPAAPAPVEEEEKEPTPPWSILTSADDLDAVVAGAAPSKTLLVVRAASENCGACAAHAPSFASLATQLKDEVEFFSFDVDDADDLADRLDVQKMPSFYLFKNGKEVAKCVGADHAALEAAVIKNKK